LELELPRLLAFFVTGLVVPDDLCMIGAPVNDTLSGGNGTYLKLSGRTADTFARSTQAPEGALLGINIGPVSPVAFPDPGCLAGTRLSGRVLD
jgi:hypothetical protein